jgi:hypothetical protein
MIGNLRTAPSLKVKSASWVLISLIEITDSSQLLLTARESLILLWILTREHILIAQPTPLKFRVRLLPLSHVTFASAGEE